MQEQKDQSIRSVRVSPLISDEGRKFLRGEVSAAAYLEEGRREAVSKAREELFQSRQLRESSRIALLVMFLSTGVGVTVFLVAAITLISSNQGLQATAALAATVVFGIAGLLVGRLASREAGHTRRRRS